MRRRRWQVEFKAQAQSDGLQRLGEMVRFVIDREVAREDIDSQGVRSVVATEDVNDGREMTT
jgi:hypothetical protein